MNQVKCYNANNIFFLCFVSSQICDYRSQQMFFAQMTACAVRYDAIYHPLSILSNIIWGRGGSTTLPLW